MSFQKLIALISIALMTTVYIGTAKGKIVKDGGYKDTIHEVVYFVDSGTGENE